MTLERAVEILNTRKHRECADWYIRDYGNGTQHVCGHDPYDRLDAFEAIAIAEKYEREQP